MSLSTFHSNPLPVASAEVFAISVLVGGNDCDKQPSYEYCGEGNKWFHHYSTLELPYDIGGFSADEVVKCGIHQVFDQIPSTG